MDLGRPFQYLVLMSHLPCAFRSREFCLARQAELARAQAGLQSRCFELQGQMPADELTGRIWVFYLKSECPVPREFTQMNQLLAQELLLAAEQTKTTKINQLRGPRVFFCVCRFAPRLLGSWARPFGTLALPWTPRAGPHRGRLAGDIRHGLSGSQVENRGSGVCFSQLKNSSIFLSRRRSFHVHEATRFVSFDKSMGKISGAPFVAVPVWSATAPFGFFTCGLPSTGKSITTPRGSFFFSAGAQVSHVHNQNRFG